MYRQTLLASTGAVATAVLTAGCANDHHQPELLVSNGGSERARGTVTVTHVDGPILFDRRIDLDPNASVEYTDVLPRPESRDGTPDTFRATAALDAGPDRGD